MFNLAADLQSLKILFLPHTLSKSSLFNSLKRKLQGKYAYQIPSSITKLVISCATKPERVLQR